MLAILHSLGMFVLDFFKSRCRLEAENAFLRHQLSVALRQAPSQRRFTIHLYPIDLEWPLLFDFTANPLIFL
jgi:hypothetical protein